MKYAIITLNIKFYNLFKENYLKTALDFFGAVDRFALAMTGKSEYLLRLPVKNELFWLGDLKIDQPRFTG